MENRCGFHESLTQQVSLRSQDLESWIPGSKADNNQLDCPSAVTIMRRKMKYYASPELGALGNDLIGINQAGANPKQPSKAPFLLKTGQNLRSTHRNVRKLRPGGLLDSSNAGAVPPWVAKSVYELLVFVYSAW